MARMIELFVSGERYGYRIYLKSEAQDMHTFMSFGSDVAAKSWPTDHLYIVFGDESMAKRIREAFLHASDLCRNKEVF